MHYLLPLLQAAQDLWFVENYFDHIQVCVCMVLSGEIWTKNITKFL